MDTELGIDVPVLCLYLLINGSSASKTKKLQYRMLSDPKQSSGTFAGVVGQIVERVEEASLVCQPASRFGEGRVFGGRVD